jgi:hypothetical protein
MVGYFFGGQSIGRIKENGPRSVGVVCEIHLEATKSVSDSPIFNIRIQASAHGESDLPVFWLLAVIAPAV